MLARLSTVIQNLHLLMVKTDPRLFEVCVLRLFRRYFIACNLADDPEKAHAAWLSLHQAQQKNVLESPKARPHRTGLPVGCAETLPAVPCVAAGRHEAACDGCTVQGLRTLGSLVKAATCTRAPCPGRHLQG